MIKEAGEVVTVENNPGFNPVAKSTFHVVVRPGAATASSDCNLNSNCRFDLPVVLAIKNHNTQKLQSLKLQMNNKPQTRVQRLILEDEQTLPEDWRNLAGLNPLEVLDYFTKHHTVLSKQLVFQEFPGVGGKKIIWNNGTGIDTCTQN